MHSPPLDAGFVEIGAQLLGQLTARTVVLHGDFNPGDRVAFVDDPGRADSAIWRARWSPRSAAEHAATCSTNAPLRDHDEGGQDIRRRAVPARWPRRRPRRPAKNHSGGERALRRSLTAAAATTAHADRARPRRDCFDSRHHDAVAALSHPESNHPIPLLQRRSAGSELLESSRALDVLYRRRRPRPPGGRTQVV